MQDDHNATVKKTAGRPTKYRGNATDTYTRKLALLGLTNEEIAAQLDINTETLYAWVKQYPTFSNALHAGKVEADAEIASSLYEKAAGLAQTIELNEVLDSNGEVRLLKKVRKHAPDTAAAFIWLKNRNPNRWKDRQEVVSTNLNIFNMSLEQAKKGVLDMLDPFSDKYEGAAPSLLLDNSTLDKTGTSTSTIVDVEPMQVLSDDTDIVE